jgi:hypothetical protein
MKTALLITGQYRPHVEGAKQLIEHMEDVFKTHTFFHTWNEDVAKVPIEYHNRLVYCKEPEVDYHPISDIEWIGKHGKWDKYLQERLLYHKTQHQNKQILAYADLLSKVPDDFDVLIRTRWDVLVSGKVNFKPYIEKAYEEGPVGFMSRPKRGHTVDQLIELPKEDTQQVLKFKLDDWYGYLPDNMIMHRREHFDSDLVKTLHKEKNLAPAEFGWYQVMSEPYGDIHTSVHGGVMLVR